MSSRSALGAGPPPATDGAASSRTAPCTALFDHIHCCVCYLDYHPTEARTAQTSDGVRRAEASLPFYVTEVRLRYLPRARGYRQRAPEMIVD
ncbi:hypothetical protein ACQY0O_001870 [Thecaphora frezii]